MIKPKNSGKKVTGGGASALGFGASVSTASFATDRDVVQALVTILEDRRALYIDHHREFSEHVTASILEIRKLITDALQQIDGKSPAVDFLRRMRAACRRYLDEVGTHHGHQNFGVALRPMLCTTSGRPSTCSVTITFSPHARPLLIVPLVQLGARGHE